MKHVIGLHTMETCLGCREFGTAWAKFCIFDFERDSTDLYIVDDGGGLLVRNLVEDSGAQARHDQSPHRKVHRQFRIMELCRGLSGPRSAPPFCVREPGLDIDPRGLDRLCQVTILQALAEIVIAVSSIAKMCDAPMRFQVPPDIDPQGLDLLCQFLQL